MLEYLRTVRERPVWQPVPADVHRTLDVAHASTLTYQTLVREGWCAVPMDLDPTPDQEAFRAEARDWLTGHVPAVPLPSLETAAWFQLLSQ